MFLTEAPGTTSLATPSALSAVKVQQQPGLQTPGTLELPPMDGEVMATPSALEAQISMGSYGPATAVQTGATGFSILR